MDGGGGGGWSTGWQPYGLQSGIPHFVDDQVPVPGSGWGGSPTGEGDHPAVLRGSGHHHNQGECVQGPHPPADVQSASAVGGAGSPISQGTVLETVAAGVSAFAEEVQGGEIEDVDSSGDIYLVADQQNKTETAYAPLTIVMKITSLHDALPFIFRDDFRKIEVLEPADHWVNGRAGGRRRGGAAGSVHP